MEKRHASPSFFSPSLWLIYLKKITNSNRNAYESLAKKFELFKSECEHELYEQLSEQFQKCLNEKLDDVSLFL